MNDRPTAISLFAGCGGDTLGLKIAGFKVIGFVEKWKPAIATHKKNFPNAIFIGENNGGDITKIPNDEFEKYKGKIDVIFAGFPCQGFSHAGKKDPNDSRNKLFWEFIRATKLIQPKWIIGENVAGLTKRKTDDGRNKIQDVIVEAFEEIGYKMAEPKILKAEEFGVPQKRRRVFFVGNKEKKEFIFPGKVYSKGQYKSVMNVVEFTLDGAMPFDPKDSNIKIDSYCESDGYEEPHGKPHPYLISKLNCGKFSFSKRDSPHHVEIVDLNNPTKTIHCGYKFQPRLFVPLKNKRGYFLRPFTVRELARIQGFPEDFIFEGKLDDIITQIGNAVPPQFVTSIANQILSTENGSATRKNNLLSYVTS